MRMRHRETDRQGERERERERKRDLGVGLFVLVLLPLAALDHALTLQARCRRFGVWVTGLVLTVQRLRVGMYGLWSLSEGSALLL